MELRRFATIIQRSWWLVLLVPIVALALSLLTLRPDPERHRVTVRFVVTQADPSDPDAVLPGFDTYNTWQSSQYVIDDLPVIVRTQAFAELVAAWLQEQRGLALEPETVLGAMYDVEREHRIIGLVIQAGTAEEALAIAQGTMAVIEAEGLGLWNRTSPGGLAVRILEMPAQATAQSRWPQAVSRLALRAIMGLVAGIGLAFARHYFDRRVRERHDLRELEAPILAVIPKEK